MQSSTARKPRVRDMDTLPASKTEVLPVHILKILTPGRLARIIMDKEENGINRLNAKVVFYDKLSEFNGAMWVGAELHERADVIRCLKEFPQ